MFHKLECFIVSLFGGCKFILQVSSIPACTNRYGAKGNGKKIRVRLCLVLALGEEGCMQEKGKCKTSTMSLNK